MAGNPDHRIPDAPTRWYERPRGERERAYAYAYLLAVRLDPNARHLLMLETLPVAPQLSANNKASVVTRIYVYRDGTGRHLCRITDEYIETGPSIPHGVKREIVRSGPLEDVFYWLYRDLNTLGLSEYHDPATAPDAWIEHILRALESQLNRKTVDAVRDAVYRGRQERAPDSSWACTIL